MKWNKKDNKDNDIYAELNQPMEETSKAEAPKVETPKVEAPKVEAPKAEAPKVEAPKVEAPKAEAPKVEAPKVEEPKAEALKVEEAKEKMPKKEATKSEEPKENNSKNGTGKKILIAIASALVVAYAIGVFVFHSRFLPNTTINGMDVSMMDAETAKSAFKEEADAYSLTLMERDGSEVILATDIGLVVDFGNALDTYIAKQNIFAWPIAFFGENETTLEQGITYDEAALKSKVNSLKCMNKSTMVAAVDAHLSEYKQGVGYEFVPAVPGTVIDEKEFWNALESSVFNLQDSMDLAAMNCYVSPVFSEDMPEAEELLATANKMVGTTVTFTFGSKTEVVDASILKDWITIEGTEVTLETEKVEEYVTDLYHNYNTVGRNVDFPTSYGVTITVNARNYGWKIDWDATYEALVGYIMSGEDYTGDVIYSQTAASHDNPVYGGTYVEVNIAAQEVFLYVNGALVLRDDMTSGKPAEDSDTPLGLFAVTYKQAPATLRGADYESDVNFWMPFYGDYGLHDAPWKKVYGKDYYLTIGSHGCVNLKYKTAQTIYNSIEAGYPVFVYYLNGTENFDTVKKLIEKIDTIGTVTKDSAPVIAYCRKVYDGFKSDRVQSSVTNYAKLVAAEEALAKLNSTPAATETPTEGVAEAAAQ